MRKTKVKGALLFMVMVTLLMLAQSALAADKKDAGQAAKPKYKKITGEVVSVSPNSIVVKSRIKGDVTLATTDKTDIIGGKAAKAGDRVTVNYRADKNGKTATRIEVLSATTAKAPQAQAAAKPAAPAAKAAK